MWQGQVTVTGATGFVGGYLVPALIDRGNPVRAMARNPSRARSIEAAGATIVTGDLLDAPSLARALDGCDTLFHLAAIYAIFESSAAGRAVRMSAVESGDSYAYQADIDAALGIS